MVPPSSGSSHQDRPDSIGRSHPPCLELSTSVKATLWMICTQRMFQATSATCMLAPEDHFWSPCLCYPSHGSGSQGLGSGHSVLALFQGPFRHDRRDRHVRHVRHGAPVHRGQNEESVIEVGALCCPHNCYMGPWEKSGKLVQERLKSCLARTGCVVCVVCE